LPSNKVLGAVELKFGENYYDFNYLALASKNYSVVI